MAPEGMVHALESIRDLLKPGGILVDIHPTGEPPRIEVQIGDQFHLAGLLQESDDFIEYFQADQALQHAVHLGWFSLQASLEFTFTTVAPDPETLFAFLRAEWHDAVLLPEVTAQAQALFLAAGRPSQTLLNERVRIARYVSLV